MAVGARNEEPIATRVLQTESGDEVKVALYAARCELPEKWTASFMITGLPKQVESHGTGIDGLQAIMLAIQGIRWELERAGVALRFLGGAFGELGIPRPIPDAYGPEIEGRLVALVESAVSDMVRSPRRKGTVGHNRKR